MMQLPGHPFQTVRWDDLPEIMTAPEAAAFLRLPKSGIYGAIRSGLLHAVNLGKRRTRISREELRKVFQGRLEAAQSTVAFSHVLEARK